MSAPFSGERACGRDARAGRLAHVPDSPRISSPNVDSSPNIEFSEYEDGTVVETDIPARLDALPWSRFHTLVVVALGVTWILDGLEVTADSGHMAA